MSESIPFQIDADPMYSWAAWGNMSYKSVADVIAELIDNSKQAGAKQVYVNVLNENGRRYITIEDDGHWEPITREILTKCFGYGKNPDAKKYGLNEHNCGLKHSLAYMDPDNKYWSIQIKKDDIVWQLTAPYTHAMTLTKENTIYFGKMTSSDSTIIKIPLGDTQFKTLYYTRSVKAPPKEEMLISRLGLYLSCFWMMCSEFMKGKFKIMLQDVLIEPYDIIRDDHVKVAGEKGKILKKKLSLTENTPEIEVEIWHLNLTSNYRKDHPLFRRNADQSGAFIFKHGRYIKGPVFPEIYGKARDYHYASHLVLVNITGHPTGLPATHTTKNDFNNKDPKLEGLYNYIKEATPAVQSTEKDKDQESKTCEIEYIRRLAQQKRKNNQRKIDKGEYVIYEQEEFKLYNETQCLQNKDKLDMVEHDKRDKLVIITEGKKDKISPEGLRQLFFYYRNLKHFCPEFQDCEFELKFITLDDRITEAYKDELIMLQKLDSLFNPSIETFAEYNIA